MVVVGVVASHRDRSVVEFDYLDPPPMNALRRALLLLLALGALRVTAYRPMKMMLVCITDTEKPYGRAGVGWRTDRDRTENERSATRTSFFTVRLVCLS